MTVGIDALNAYGGHAYIHVKDLFEARGLDLSRFNNLMMKKKSVGLPCEDAVTNAVNAAKPLLDRMSEEEKNTIELVITASESGLDFGKSLSNYIHTYLNLPRTCRMFEIKQACYGGTAALQMAAGIIASHPNPDMKALVIATDLPRAAVKMTYMEPSQGTGAVAMIISRSPRILALDYGATGYYGYDVWDTFRPQPDMETGDPDLSLLSYLNCVEQSYRHYESRVEGADFCKTFHYFAFHTPFAGMVKGAHRKLMRAVAKAEAGRVEEDFAERVSPSLTYCTEVGNIYSATVYLALSGLIDTVELTQPKRIGLFSYGSGCASEFFSGVITPESKKELAPMAIGQKLAERVHLSMEDYDRITDATLDWGFGVTDKAMDITPFEEIFNRHLAGNGYLVLKEVKDHKRLYEWS